MKKITENIAEIDGFKLVKLSFETKMGNAVKLEETPTTVWKRAGLTAAFGCNIIIGGYSCSTFDIWELGQPRISHHRYQSLLGYTYCLPENLNEVRLLFLKKIKSYMESMLLDIDFLRDNVLWSFKSIPNKVPISG